MRLILDTHAFLWFISDTPLLSSRARELIEDGENEVLLSAASIWEMAIKVSLGKLAVVQPLEILLPTEIIRNDIQLLPVEMDHAIKVASLPFHHRDPFDRLLIAQGMVEEIPIVGADRIFDEYGVERIW